MKIKHAFLIGGVLLSVPAWAVYAPVPEQDQGKAWTVSLMGGVFYDSNIFASQANAISSMVYTVSPTVSFNASVTDQTFLSASYEPTMDNFKHRPGSTTLYNHDVMARVAHAFTQATTLDLSDTFLAEQNPSAELNGLPLNTDQSFKSNEFDGSFTTSLTEKADVTLKVRSLHYHYDNASLGTNLDRTENLYGVSGDYAVLPEVKAVAEYRYQTIDYAHAGVSKDKNSNFGLVGLDYTATKKLTASGRLGFEHRQRDSQGSVTAPYAELSAKYDYAQGSFVSGGYEYTLEETSNVVLYTDEQVNRFFVNVQHAVTALITASASLDYEPSLLKGRIGLRNADENTTRAGVALSYLPNKNWVISASYDYDKVTSDDTSRDLNRDRVGVSATFTF